MIYFDYNLNLNAKRVSLKSINNSRHFYVLKFLKLSDIFISSAVIPGVQVCSSEDKEKFFCHQLKTLRANRNEFNLHDKCCDEEMIEVFYNVSKSRLPKEHF